MGNRRAWGAKFGGAVPQRSKYGSRATIVDGIRFASAKEALRYSELKYWEMTGEISDLRLQVRYPLSFDGAKVATYVADFVYRRNGSDVIEDSKGFKTREYLLKKKLMAAQGLTIVEV